MRTQRIILLCFALLCAAIFYSTEYFAQNKQNAAPVSTIITSNQMLAYLEQKQAQPRFSGKFLSSRFAQGQQQWDDAATFISQLQDIQPASTTILKKAMVFHVSAGNIEKALQAAKDLLQAEEEPANVRALAELFVITGQFKNEQYDLAQIQINTMTEDNLSAYLKPLFNGWVQASKGNFYSYLLTGHALHIRHAALIAQYLGDDKKLEQSIKALKRQPQLTVQDQEFIKSIEDGTAEKITSPVQGLAEAYFDLTEILNQDRTYESARIFAQLALYLNPNDSKIINLIAGSEAESGHYNKALALYKQIPAGDKNYKSAQLKIAKIYEYSDQENKAIKFLNDYYNASGTPEALVEIISIHRNNDDHKEALKIFKKLENKWGEYNFPEEYWYLYYMRGMSREQTGQWDSARADLEKALSYEPGHPFILNYLGYSMADRGIELDSALSMIKQALEFKPNDGYITDSVGWVYYKLGQYEKAVPYLEQAVEILPGDAVINDHLGDAYWRVGRKLEARYQWKRAINAAQKDETSENTDLTTTIQDKIKYGLDDIMASNEQEITQPKTNK